MKARCPFCGLATITVDARGRGLSPLIPGQCWACARGQQRPLTALERPYFRPTYRSLRPLVAPDEAEAAPAAAEARPAQLTAPASGPLSEEVRLKFTRPEKTRLRQMAKSRGVTLSKLLRDWIAPHLQ